MSKEQIRRVAIDHHHQVAGDFESWYADLAKTRFSSAFTYGRAKIDRLVDDLFRSLPKGGSILDVGCGTGEHLKRAIGMGLKATGVEPADAMLEAAERNVPKADLHAGVATKLPFSDGQFDAVIMIEVLRYLHKNDIDVALSEARRVLKPGGVVLVTLVNRWSLDGFFILQRIRSVVSGVSDRHPYCYFYTPASAEAAFRKAGFTDLCTEGRLFAPVRIAYKINKRFGGKFAEKIEKLDDRFHSMQWTRGLAGHLIVTGR